MGLFQPFDSWWTGAPIAPSAALTAYAAVVMNDAPDAYWALADAPAAASGADLAASPHPLAYRNRPGGGGPADVVAPGGAFGRSTIPPLVTPNSLLGGLTFDGATQLARATGPNFDGSTKGAINLWFYQTVGGANVQVINSADTQFTGKGVEISISSNQTLFVCVGNASGLATDLDKPATPGRWHMLTVQWDLTALPVNAPRYNRVWLDGGVVAYAVAAQTSVVDTGPTGGSIVMGRYKTLDQNYFNGALAHVELFTNRLLAPERIAARWHQAQATGLGTAPPPQQRGNTRLWGYTESGWGTRHHITPAPTAPLAWDSLSQAQQITIICRHDVLHDFLSVVNATGAAASDISMRGIFDVKPNILLGGYANMTSDEAPWALGSGYQGGGIVQGNISAANYAAMRLKNAGGAALVAPNGRAMMDPGRSGAGDLSWRGHVAQALLDVLAGNWWASTGQDTYARSSTLGTPVTWTRRDGVTSMLGVVFVDDCYGGYTRAGYSNSGLFGTDAAPGTLTSAPFNPRTGATYTDADWSDDLKASLDYVVQTVKASYPGVLVIFNGAWSFGDAENFGAGAPFGAVNGQAPTSGTASTNLATLAVAHAPDGLDQELFMHLFDETDAQWNDLETWALNASHDAVQTRAKIALVQPATLPTQGLASPFKNAPAGSPVSFEPDATTNAHTQPVHRYCLCGALAAQGSKRAYWQFWGFDTGLTGNASLANDRRTQELMDPGRTCWPYSATALGTAVGTAAAACALTGTGAGLYQRDFEFGFVLVNTNAVSNRTVTLPATDGRGRAVATWYTVGLDGAVSAGTAAGGTYVVNARDGAIVLSRKP